MADVSDAVSESSAPPPPLVAAPPAADAVESIDNGAGDPSASPRWMRGGSPALDKARDDDLASPLPPPPAIPPDDIPPLPPPPPPPLPLSMDVLAAWMRTRGAGLIKFKFITVNSYCLISLVNKLIIGQFTLEAKVVDRVYVQQPGRW